MCIRCGREVEKLVDGRLCPQCYLEVYGLGRMPSTLTITICPRCGSFRYQGRWYPPPGGGSIEDIVALVAQAVFKPTEYVEYYRVEGVEIDYELGRALVTLVGKFKGVPGEYKATYNVNLTIKKQLCPACFQRAAGTPNAILQIRGYNGRLDEEEKEAIERLINSMGGASDAVIGVEEVREGVNYKLLDQNIARHIAAKIRSSMAAIVKESYKVVGRRSDGKRRSRLTLSVRLPFFREGSIVDYGGRLAIVERISNGFVHVRRLGANKVYRLTVEEAWKLLKRPSYEERRVMIAALEPGWIHIQYLDGDYGYEEIPLSNVRVEGSIKAGSEAKLIVYNGHYYLLPV
jgi:nonsense-mediated mRNA decay protein 3